MHGGPNHRVPDSHPLPYVVDRQPNSRLYQGEYSPRTAKTQEIVMLNCKLTARSMRLPCSCACKEARILECLTYVVDRQGALCRVSSDGAVMIGGAAQRARPHEETFFDLGNTAQSDELHIQRCQSAQARKAPKPRHVTTLQKSRSVLYLPPTSPTPADPSVGEPVVSSEQTKKGNGVSLLTMKIVTVRKRSLGCCTRKYTFNFLTSPTAFALRWS